MSVLYYIHDPMCSWCWGFTPVLKALTAALPRGLGLRRLLGGLAPDSAQPMPEPMRLQLQATWRRIQQLIPGTEFNFDFWTRNTPRRATYPACRAVIAARLQGEVYDPLMTQAIQRAYYLQARNPSEESTLMELAGELGLDTAAFGRDLRSKAVERCFAEERRLAAELGARGFPSLVLETGGRRVPVPIDYTDAAPMLAAVEAALKGGRS